MKRHIVRFYFTFNSIHKNSLENYLEVDDHEDIKVYSAKFFLDDKGFLVSKTILHLKLNFCCLLRYITSN